ncbi:MAG: TATA-box-binding protein [Thermoplasmata archaeon]|nr:MAG: TATA-box-binding protein [Thermoplasmata archaeon]
MVDYTIENVIVTTSIKADLNLKNIASTLPNVEYNPEYFPGLVLKLEDPKTATFILKNGKTVCIGGKNFKESRLALETVTKNLTDAGVEIKDELDIDVQNIIASLDLNTPLNLHEVEEVFNREQTTYKPDEFQGLVYNTELNHVTILLFETGKIVCYGAKKLSEVKKVLDKFVNRLHAVGLI